ncbi:hypothetical protein RRF57_012744 [Xylaria bambusicola]|uniref:Uncharacterized protein n=1 Tax=Xylaria bambusicola TaxID=326684 RepID=A0AAN7UVQ2_9PEZI
MENPKHYEAQAETAADDHEVPPPPYQNTDYSTNNYPPSEPAPSYHDGESSAAAGPISGVNSKFPPALNAYYKWGFTKTFYLGETKDTPRLAGRWHSRLSKKPELELFDGPDDKGALLATAHHGSISKSATTLTIPAREGVPHDTESQQVTMSCPKLLKSKTYAFAADVGVGKETRREEFEWRPSHGSEVREVGGLRWGWKLVRLSESVGGGGDRATRELGSTSDGLEVVAAWAHNSSASMTKAFKFQLMGASLTGMLGERGAAVALISALWIWTIEVATSSAA